jgi:hypothetical protein
MTHRRRLGILTTSLCLPLALGAAAAAATASAPAPARHRFAVAVSTGSSKLSGARGAATVLLRTGAGTTTRALRIVFTGDRCHGRTGCVALTGTLKGTITAVAQHIPDAGRQFRVSARGRLSPLGHVTVTGTIRGTGNIRFGQESLQLTVRSGHGTLGVDGRSARVPGFTSP